MHNYALKLEFDGSKFCGSQIQNNGRTIQGEIQRALSTILRTYTKVTLCSRTDSGVHANEFVCNFFNQEILDEGKLTLSLNALLPKEIAVLGCFEVPLEFHSRKSAIKKEYVYLINTSKCRRAFLNQNLIYNYGREIDVDLLNHQAQSFVGTYDFSAFASSGCEIENKIRTVFSANVCKYEKNIVSLSFCANGFLYNMVRIMVGTLLDINDNKIPSDSINSIILSKNRLKAGFTAPANGLYLNKIYYGQKYEI